MPPRPEERQTPQPSIERLPTFAGHPIVVGIHPGQPDLVAHTAAQWARALGSPALYCAYVDPARYTVEEFADGTVRHSAMDPDSADDAWRDRAATLSAALGPILNPLDVPWEFRYLAGRADRALTHLARAVDAGAIAVGTTDLGRGRRLREFAEGSVALRLSRHQHRPVLVIPVQVIDWKEPLPWR